MVRKLYHGSPSIVEHPKFGYEKRCNGYGPGFYCTDSLEIAGMLPVFIGKLSNIFCPEFTENSQKEED